MESLTGDRDRCRRLVERLRGMSEASLTRSRDGLTGRSVATAVHDLCVWAAGREGVPSPVPLLHPLASGDQLWVIGSEFLEWIELSADQQALSTWRDELDQIRRAV